MKRMLIIGGNGFLGSHLAREFAQDYSVTITVRRGSDRSRLKLLAGACSCVDPSTTPLSSIIAEQRFDIIINAAVSYGRTPNAASSAVESNLLLPVQALETGVQNGCSFFINTDSFFSRIPDPYPYLQEYRLSKIQLHSWLERFASECRVINMQLEHMYGEYDDATKFLPSMVEQIVGNRSEIKLTPGLQTRDFIHVTDVARAYRSVIESAEAARNTVQTIQVGTGEAHSIKDTLTLIKEHAGSSTTLLFGQLPYRENELMHSEADITALSETGWSPAISWSDGLHRLVSFYRCGDSHA